MKIAMLILGIIGALAGFGGSVMTVIGGFVGTAAGVMSDENKTAMTGAMVFWAGVYTLVISGMALITSVVGGVAKNKVTIQTFSIATLILGAVSIYLFNFISGGLLLVAGLLGVIGAKGAEQSDKSLLKSFLFYFISALMIVAVVFAFAIRNANDMRKNNSDEKKEAQSPSNVSPTPQPNVQAQNVENSDPKSIRAAMFVTEGRWTKSDPVKCLDPIVVDSQFITVKGKKYPATYKKHTEDEYCLDVSAEGLQQIMNGVLLCASDKTATIYDEAKETKGELEQCK